MIGHHVKNTSEGFDLTTRNINHPFHSSPHTQQKFNTCRYKNLKMESRFYTNLLEKYEREKREFSQESLDSQEEAVVLNEEKLQAFSARVSASNRGQGCKFDIKGNSFKTTLFPKETVGNKMLAFKRRMKTPLSYPD